jgi:hypothetical protein
MLMMAAMATTVFVGITLLGHAYGVLPSEQETVVSQIARGVFGGRGVPYYLVQAARTLILMNAHRKPRARPRCDLIGIDLGFRCSQTDHLNARSRTLIRQERPRLS